MKTSFRNNKFLQVGAFALAAALSLTACNGSSGGNGNAADATLLIGTTTDVVNFSPLNTVSITDMWVMNQLYPALFRTEVDGSLRPIAAKSATISDDGKSVGVVLNEKFMWSDGEKVTASDLKFTLDRFVSDKLLQGTTIRENYDSAEVLSPTELKVNMKSASYAWAQDFMRSAQILPEHVFKDVPDLAKYPIDAHEDAWVSGGAFNLTGITKGQRYKFTRNKDYPLSAPGNAKISGIEFRIYQDINTMQLALQSGDLDVAAPSIPASAVSSLESKPGIDIVEVEDAVSLSKMTFNLQSKALESAAVRQAISGLIDTQAILDSVLQGRGTHEIGPVLPIYKEYQPSDLTDWKSTPDEARKVMESAGFKDSNNDGVFDDLDLKILCDQGNANHAKSAQVIHDDLAKAGIKSTVACSERATSLAAAKAGKFDVYIHKLNQLYSPGTNLELQFGSSNKAGLNYNYGSDHELDELLQNALSTIDEKSYQEATKIAAMHIHEQALMVPLYVESLNNASNSKRFGGYVQSPMENVGPVDAFSLSQVVPAK